MLVSRFFGNSFTLHMGILKFLVIALVGVFSESPLSAQTVTATVNVGNSIATLPEYGMGVHTSVYDGALRYEGSPVFSQLDSSLDDAGVDVLRYPGGGYADIFHFSTSRSYYDGGLVGHGFTPWWGEEDNYGWMSGKTDFGNFVKLLDATNSKTIITLNTGGALKYDNPSNPSKLVVPSHGGQPQEAAAWVAYANADAGIYGTPSDIALGVDAEGNDWKTAGYWAKLRASTPSQYSSWAGTDGVYDANNAFLAIDRDAPVGIQYWEIGNETFGTGYYGGGNGYALNYAAPYDGTNRDDNPVLSPAAYGQQVNAFVSAMKAVDPTIKAGAVLATPPGDYSWSYADLNDNGVKTTNEPYWNDEVLSHTDAGLGKVADNVDFVIVHWYPWFAQGDDAGILNAPRTTIPQMIHGTTPGIDTGSNAGLRDSIAAWRTDGDANALEIFVTETDGAGYVPAVDGLFAADEYVTFFENGVSNVDWLELHSSFLDGNNSADFAYFGVQAVHLLAEAGEELLSTTTSENDVRIHAALQADGSVAVMVLNLNTSGTRTVNVSINGSTLSEDGLMYQTDGDSPLWPADVANLGNSFSTSIAARTLQLFVIPPLPQLDGDFNGDHVVDAADYTVWRNGLGSTYTQNDYDVWKANFGNSSTAAASAAGVPEPTTLLLGCVGLLAGTGRRRAKRSLDGVSFVACT
jgi:alpha-L-arabinofuranosidase